MFFKYLWLFLASNKMFSAPKEKGQGLVEYALILVLIAVVVIAVLTLVGPAIGDIFSSIMESLAPGA